MVLSAAVVPECHRIRLPLEAHAELGRLHLPIEHVESRVAFILTQTDNMRGEEAVHEQAFPAGFGMRPNNRMLSARVNSSAVIVSVPTAIVLLAIMQSGQTIDQLADWFRQHLIGKIHV